MNIRELKNKLVDFILHPHTNLEDSGSFHSWEVTNSTISEHITYKIDNHGVEIVWDDGYDFLESSVKWNLFPETYKTEIIAALSVDDRMDSDAMNFLDEIFRVP